MIKIGAKIFKYGLASFTGYEISELAQGANEEKKSKEVIERIIEKKSNTGLEESLFDIKVLLLIILLAILFAFVLLLGYKLYSAIGKKATKKFKRTLEAPAVQGTFKKCAMSKIFSKLF